MIFINAVIVNAWKKIIFKTETGSGRFSASEFVIYSQNVTPLFE